MHSDTSGNITDATLQEMILVIFTRSETKSYA